MLDPTADFYDCVGKLEQKAVMTDANRKKPTQEGQIRPKLQKKEPKKRLS